ncbi:MAG: hypothetical protein IJ759_07925 [Bacteroidales bacterium]|nr:hypothetical protein [Bacteroidales bacterium]
MSNNQISSAFAQSEVISNGIEIAVTYKDVLNQNTLLKSKKYEDVRAYFVAMVGTMTANDDVKIKSKFANKYLPITEEEAKEAGIRFTAKGTSCFFLLQYLYQVIKDKKKATDYAAMMKAAKDSK